MNAYEKESHAALLYYLCFGADATALPELDHPICGLIAKNFSEGSEGPPRTIRSNR